MVDFDAKRLDRIAPRLLIEARRGRGTPPVYESPWLPVWNCKVERIQRDINAAGSSAVIWFPHLPWNADSGLYKGDLIRIKTVADVIVFSGFVVRQDSGFFGGSGADQDDSWERNALYCRGPLWLLAATSSLAGQLARSRDDYTDYGTASQAAIADSYTYLTGRRCIFNADGRPNRDPDLLTVNNNAGYKLCDIAIFADPDRNTYWTARQMLGYCLSPLFNHAYQQLTIAVPELLLGLNHSDWDKILNHVPVEGLNCVEAVSLICQRLGWGYREHFDPDNNPTINFFKYGGASGYSRTGARAAGTVDQTTILHHLFAPARGETITTAVAAGKKMCWGMDLAEDIAPLVNTPIGLGGLQRFEFTAELIPAWLDSDLEPDTQQSNIYLFLTEADLQYETTPDDYTYYKYYHPRGSDFRRSVGRIWSLNDTGRYTDPAAYDRGAPFDYATVIPAQYILDAEGKRLYGPFNRQLIDCLTTNTNDYNSVGILVEFSFDGGSTWQVIPCAIGSLPDEAGIYIAEANLAEIVDAAEGLISGGALDGVALNYWSSLSDDKLNGRSFKNGQWKTRIRITASVQLDQRLFYKPSISDKSGSPFEQVVIHDYSGKYALAKRTASSIFAASDLPAREVDATTIFNQQIEALREANQDLAISGQFTLDRMWLDDDNGQPDFAVGDGIETIAGRQYNLKASLGAGGAVYPEIVRIIYYPEKPQQKLVTRDLRFAEMIV